MPIWHLWMSGNGLWSDSEVHMDRSKIFIKGWGGFSEIPLQITTIILIKLLNQKKSISINITKLSDQSNKCASLKTNKAIPLTHFYPHLYVTNLTLFLFIVLLPVISFNLLVCHSNFIAVHLFFLSHNIHTLYC